ncbi:hypothetical protein SAMN02744784_00023 [Stenotrophomonas sp. CC120223-11]|nr:hypothetical protein SAMN02744784_00023 [Stenotrophomonas sp. CC120223-11]
MPSIGCARRVEWPAAAGRPQHCASRQWSRHSFGGRRRPCLSSSRSKASPTIASHNCAAKRSSSWSLGHDRASSLLSGIEMPSSRFIAEAYQCCCWRGARNICCCVSHWTRRSGRPPLCGCGRSSNGNWSRWIIWSRCWLACRNLFCWIGCCRCSRARCMRGCDVVCCSRALLDSTVARAAAAQVRGWSLPARPRKCPGGCAARSTTSPQGRAAPVRR